MRNTIRRALEFKGHQVLEASGGEEALQLFGQEDRSIRLVILDIVMPGISGWDVLAQMKSRAPQIPILLVSGYAWAGERQEHRAEQADGLLRKPFELVDLIDHVTRLL